MRQEMSSHRLVWNAKQTLFLRRVGRRASATVWERASGHFCLRFALCLRLSAELRWLRVVTQRRCAGAKGGWVGRLSDAPRSGSRHVASAGTGGKMHGGSAPNGDYSSQRDEAATSLPPRTSAV